MRRRNILDVELQQGFRKMERILKSGMDLRVQGQEARERDSDTSTYAYCLIAPTRKRAVFPSDFLPNYLERNETITKRHLTGNTYRRLGKSRSNASSFPGIVLQGDLRWKKQVERVVAKGRRALGMLGRMLNGVSCEVKEKAYGTMVRSMLEYAAAVWDLYVEVEVRELKKVQRKAARWVKGRWRRQLQDGEEEGNYTPSVVMKEMGWSSLKDRRKVERLVRMYRMVNEEEGWGGLHCKLSKGVFRGRGNNSEKLQMVWRRTERGRQSMLVRSVREWNVLREELVFVRGVGKFRKGVEKELAGSSDTVHVLKRPGNTYRLQLPRRCRDAKTAIPTHMVSCPACTRPLYANNPLVSATQGNCSRKILQWTKLTGFLSLLCLAHASEPFFSHLDGAGDVSGAIHVTKRVLWTRGGTTGVMPDTHMNLPNSPTPEVHSTYKYRGETVVAYTDNSSRSDQKNGVIGHHHVGTLFSNQHLGTYATDGTPANRSPFTARSSQSDTRLVPKASRDQSENRIASLFRLCLLIYSVPERFPRAVVAHGYSAHLVSKVHGIMFPLKKHPDRWTPAYIIHEKIAGQRKTIKELTLEMCDKRDGGSSSQVRVRVEGAVSDLHAADSRYHEDCHNSFMGDLAVDAANQAKHDAITLNENYEYFKEVVDTLKADESCTWNSFEIFKLYEDRRGTRLRRRQLLKALTDTLKSQLIVMSSRVYASVVIFRKKANHVLQLTPDNDCDYLSESISLISRQIKKEMKDIVIDMNHYTYHLKSECVCEEMSQTLMKLLASLCPKLDKMPSAFLIGNVVTATMLSTATSLQVALEVKILYQHVILANEAGSKDVNFLEDIIFSVLCPEYHGYNTRACREKEMDMKPATSGKYQPLIGVSPSHPDTTMTEMMEAQRHTKIEGQDFTMFTCDQQLYRVALKITWAYPDMFDDVFLHLGGFWNGVWSDMWIEITFMCFGYGLKGIIEITLKPEAVKTWVLSIHVCTRLEEDVVRLGQEEFGYQQNKQDKHKEEMKSRIEADAKDREGI
ncbi:hypothetical protein PR048_016011 [Dryococelus australis]|uniref:Uncharacterized protein n=1 Tax=Dryococelus australis TaxID=614101 RepID=A0ABQ9HIW7_9NEOP|nr:hypothetical protein PR048_016011 [Dryococelus australis]